MRDELSNGASYEPTIHSINRKPAGVMFKGISAGSILFTAMSLVYFVWVMFGDGPDKANATLVLT